MEKVNVIHIFGYGETQIIGKDFNKKVASTELTKLKPVVDMIYGKRPKDYQGTNDYHLINLFVGRKVDFRPKDSEVKAFDLEYTEMDEKKISALIKEISEKEVPTEV